MVSIVYGSDVVLGLDALPQGCLEALHCLALPCLDQFSKCLALSLALEKMPCLVLGLGKNALPCLGLGKNALPCLGLEKIALIFQGIYAMVPFKKA